MKSNLLVLVGLLIAGIMLVAVAVVPQVQTERLRNNGKVLVQLERARRLLAQYDSYLTDTELRREVFEDVQDPLADVDINELLSDPQVNVEELTNTELAEYGKLPAISSMKSAEQDLLALVPAAGAPYSPATRLRGSSMVQQGHREYEQQVTRNSQILQQAEAAVKEALAIVPDHGAANRLLGMIHYQRGLADTRRLALLRAELGAQRFALARTLELIALVGLDREIVAQSEIDQRITTAQQEAREAGEQASAQESVVAELESRVAELRERLTDAVGRSEAAREAMEALQDEGVDLSNPSGFEDFRSAYEQQANNYRIAVIEAHVYHYGTLANAAIDYTGDYIHGQYEPIIESQGIEFDRGLVHYEQDLDSAKAQLEKMKQTQQRLADNVESLRNLRELLQQRADQASAAVTELREQALAQFNDFKSVESGVAQASSDAQKLFESASKIFARAETGVSSEERLAQQERPSNPQRQSYHYSEVAGNQNWLKGQIEAEQADCELRMGLIDLGRYQEASANLSSLQGLSDLVDVSEDRANWESTVQEASQQALEHSQQALALFRDRAKNHIGEGNWVIAAQIGCAWYIQAQLGVELAAEKALEWYKAAVDTREDKAFALDHVAMKEYIEARLGAASQ